MFSSEPAGLDEVLIKGRAHTAVLLESAPFFQKQRAHSVKDRIISAVDRERKRLSSKIAAGRFQAFNGFVPPVANRLCFGVIFQSETPSSSMIL